jgi:hypothetical protein
MKHTRLALALSAVLASTLPSISQAQEQDQAGTVANDQILLKQVMTDKRAVYARNLDMSASESAAFWPIYDEYEAKVKKLDDRFLDLVNQYAEKYDSLADTDATAMLKEKMDIEKERSISSCRTRRSSRKSCRPRRRCAMRSSSRASTR